MPNPRYECSVFYGMRVGLTCAILVLGLIFSCRKNPPKNIMPPLTESGQHTLGCYINDQAWIPYDRGSHERYELPHPTITEEGGLKISATRINEENSARNWFCIEIAEGCFSEGKYEISNTQCQSPYQTFYYGEHSNMAGDIYAIDSTLPHFMEITYLNLDQKIAAGTFEFTAISHRDTISVTSGRFDLKLK